MHFPPLSIFIICSTAFLTGISRTAIPGLGTLLVPLAAMAMPARVSTGFLLPMLVVGDFTAVFYWRRRIAWPYLVRILPWAAGGVAVGFFAMKLISESVFKPLLGGMIVGIMALDLIRRWVGVELKAENRIFAAVMGILSGAFTMIANAAGPITTIYLLSMGLPKEEFVGTSAVFYWLINLFKLPFSILLGLITWRSFKFDLMMIPLIALGCLIGILSLKRLPQRTFNLVAQVLAFLAGVKLFF